MSERLPYEEQLPSQWDALPLPDENLAWADMKRRLDEDDDRKPIAWWSRGCMLWGFLLLVLLGGGWWLFRPDKWFDKKNEKQSVIINTENKKPISHSTLSGDTTTLATTTQQSNTIDTGTNQQKMKIESLNQQERGSIDQQQSMNTSAEKKKRQVLPIKSTTSKPPRSITKPGTQKDKTQLSQSTDVVIKQEPKEKQSVVVNDTVQPGSDTPAIRISQLVGKTDTTAIVVKKDTTKKISLREDTVALSKNSKTGTREKKPIFYSAGIAIHQQLPVAGQEFTPYNALGRKGSIADYIPSVYFRLNKQDRWFLQAEFRYGAPQLNKGTIFDQRAVPDTGQNPQFTTYSSLNVKKTFYHQLPLSFHYNITKSWTIGTGIQWNFFKSAVVENESYVRFVQSTSDTLQTKKLVSFKGDSARQFSKSYFLGLLETEYKWKRFSAGARYAFGLQPYIRFSLPGQPLQQQRSTSLQIFLRYQLWRSKDK